MKVLTVASTKGGVGKTTVTANLGGLMADAGLRVLMLDLDSQPTLSSYFTLKHVAAAGTCELIGQRLGDLPRLVSRTDIPDLHLVLSNDPLGQLNTQLLHAPDGRLRLKNLLHLFKPHYDLVLLDTQGARSIVVEMSVLAADLLLSPIPPEMLAARELHRGTLALLESLAPFAQLGVVPPPAKLVINQADMSRRDTQLIIESLRQEFSTAGNVALCDAVLLDRVAYVNAASMALPVHRVDQRPSPSGSPSAGQSMVQLAAELFPEWQSQLAMLPRLTLPPFFPLS